MSEIITHVLPGGATVLVEPIPSVRSVALSWRVPAGSAFDPPDRLGQSAALAEIIFRGAGGLDSRSHSDALDRLGVQRYARTSGRHLHIDATVLDTRLHDALPLLAALIRSPEMPADGVAPVASLCRQALDGLEDEPQQLAMLGLREQHLAPPFDRHGYGTASTFETLTADELRAAWQERFVGEGSILAVAGAVEADDVVARLSETLEPWAGAPPAIDTDAEARRGYRHVEQDSSQVHLALAYDAPAEIDDTSMVERLATSALGGSTSGRLFTEVRQKRSLCYSVGASYRARRDSGWVAIYAGTTPERAQETLDVCLAELDRLRGGITEEEFARARIGLKSRLIMEGESTPARAAALGSDFFRRGQARTLDEVATAIEAVTLEELNAYLAQRDFGPVTVVSIGPSPLNVPTPSVVR